jgi:electron transport complex protein RnfG
VSDAGGTGRSGGSPGRGSGAARDAASQPSSSRLIGTLGLLSVVAGVLIVLVYGWAQPQIAAHQAAELRQAIEEVLGEPPRFETRWVEGGRLLDSLPAGVDSSSANPVYAGYDASGRLVGYAIPGEKPGYQDVVKLIFGYDPTSGKVLGMKVLESKETPGLGAKITSDSAFIHGFDGVLSPLNGVKHPAEGPHDVQMITGATISSTTVIKIINQSLAVVGPALGGPGARAAAEGGDGP